MQPLLRHSECERVSVCLDNSIQRLTLSLSWHHALCRRLPGGKPTFDWAATKAKRDAYVQKLEQGYKGKQSNWNRTSPPQTDGSSLASSLPRLSRDLRGTFFLAVRTIQIVIECAAHTLHAVHR
eukprot:SAG11_NODE_116_length_16002_cov_19.164560_15_plen_124_part_00